MISDAADRVVTVVAACVYLAGHSLTTLNEMIASLITEVFTKGNATHSYCQE